MIGSKTLALGIRKKLPAAVNAAGSFESFKDQLLYKIHDLRDISGAEL